MQVQDIMSSNVATCGHTESQNHAAHLMWERDCGALPVVDDSKRVIGMVTDRDLCMGTYTTGKRMVSIPVTNAMATLVFSSRPEDSLETALQSMSKHQLHRLPVIDEEDHLVGILTLNDIARHVEKIQDQSERSLLGVAVAHALAAVSGPRMQADSLVPQEPVATSRTTAPRRRARLVSPRP